MTSSLQVSLYFLNGTFDVWAESAYSLVMNTGLAMNIYLFLNNDNNKKLPSIDKKIPKKSTQTKTKNSPISLNLAYSNKSSLKEHQ